MSVLRYTCIHCGKTYDLGEDRFNSVFTCPACQFSNWVSGVMVQRLGEPTAPGHVANGGQVARAAPRTAASAAGPHAKLPQAHPRPVAPPPLPSSGGHVAHPRPQAPAARHPDVGERLKPPADAGADSPPQKSAQQILEDFANRHAQQGRGAVPPATRQKYHYPTTPPTAPDAQDLPFCTEAIVGAIAAMIGLFWGWLGPLAIVLGLLAKAKTAGRHKQYQGSKMATFAIGLGLLDLILVVVQHVSR